MWLKSLWIFGLVCCLVSTGVTAFRVCTAHVDINEMSLGSRDLSPSHRDRVWQPMWYYITHSHKFFFFFKEISNSFSSAFKRFFYFFSIWMLFSHSDWIHDEQKTETIFTQAAAISVCVCMCLCSHVRAAASLVSLRAFVRSKSDLVSLKFRMWIFG